MLELPTVLEKMSCYFHRSLMCRNGQLKLFLGLEVSSMTWEATSQGQGIFLRHLATLQSCNLEQQCMSWLNIRNAKNAQCKMSGKDKGNELTTTRRTIPEEIQAKTRKSNTKLKYHKAVFFTTHKLSQTNHMASVL